MAIKETGHWNALALTCFKRVVRRPRLTKYRWTKASAGTPLDPPKVRAISMKQTEIDIYHRIRVIRVFANQMRMYYTLRFKEYRFAHLTMASALTYPRWR